MKRQNITVVFLIQSKGYVNADNSSLPTINGQEAVLLLKADELRPKVYRLKIGNDVLHIGTEQVIFETAAETTKFYQYIGELIRRNQPINTVLVNGIPLTGAAYPAVRIVTETF